MFVNVKYWRQADGLFIICFSPLFISIRISIEDRKHPR